MTVETANAPDEGSELVGQVGRGLGWSFANNFVARVGNLALGIALARMLVPEDYGVYAVALVVLNATLSMNELGVSLAVIRWPEPISRIAPTVATLAIVWSLLLYALCYLVAPSLASGMGAPEAAPVIRLLSLAVVVNGLAAVSAALVTRHFMQVRRMVVDLAGLVVGGVVSIGLAVAGFGAWALAWGFLATTATAGLLIIAWAPRRYRPGWDRRQVRPLVTYGLPLAGASTLMFLMLNLDYVIVGHQFGPKELGFYLLAFNLCTWPVNLVSSAIRKVSFAGFARAFDNPDRIGEVFCRSAALVLALVVPICALLGVYAYPTVTLLYGDQWAPSVAVLQVLCVFGGVRVLLELAYDFLAAAGMGPWNLALQGLWLVLLVPALLVGAASDGIRGVATAHAVVAVCFVLPAYLAVLRRVPVRISSLAVLSVRPLVAGLLVIGSGLVMSRAIDGAWATFFLGGLVSTALAVAVLHPMRGLVRFVKEGGEVADAAPHPQGT